MAKAYRTNRNSGPDQMTNKDYERITQSETSGIPANAGFLKSHSDSSKSSLNHHIWLRLLGLMETWDMRRYRLSGIIK